MSTDQVDISDSASPAAKIQQPARLAAKIQQLARKCDDVTFLKEVESIFEADEGIKTDEDMDEALKKLVNYFFENRYDQSALISEDLKACMISAQRHYAATEKNASLPEPAPIEEALHKNEPGNKPSPIERTLTDEKPADHDFDIASAVANSMQNKKSPPDMPQPNQAGSARVDVIGSLLTSFGSLWDANKRAFKKAADYIGNQAEIEFGREQSSLYRPVFGEGRNGADFSKHDLALERIELAGRRLEEGRQVNFDAVQRDMNYLKSTMADIHDDQALSAEDMARLKKTRDAMDEFSERAEKAPAEDANMKKNIEEMVKLAQDIGRMISSFVERVANTLKKMVGADPGEGEPIAQGHVQRPKA